jgi:hypothetical protein
MVLSVLLASSPTAINHVKYKYSSFQSAKTSQMAWCTVTASKWSNRNPRNNRVQHLIVLGSIESALKMIQTIPFHVYRYLLRPTKFRRFSLTGCIVTNSRNRSDKATACTSLCQRGSYNACPRPTKVWEHETWTDRRYLQSTIKVWPGVPKVLRVRARPYPVWEYDFPSWGFLDYWTADAGSLPTDGPWSEWCTRDRVISNMPHNHAYST